MLQLRLKPVEMGANFRYSEETLMANWLKEHKDEGFAKDEVVVFVARSLNQIQFVYYAQELNHAGRTVLVLASTRLRLLGGAHWNPMMLADYAETRDIKLVNYPKFKELFLLMQDRRRKEGR